MPWTLTVLMVRSFSAGRSDSLTPLKTFLDSVAAVADFLHSFLNRWGKRFATLKEKTRIAKAMFSHVTCPGSRCSRMLAADYNGTRPHSQLGWSTPSEFALSFHPRRDLALRYAKGSARQLPSLTSPNRAIQTPGANSPLDKTWGQGH
jgi:hypothetical protein